MSLYLKKRKKLLKKLCVGTSLFFFGSAGFFVFSIVFKNLFSRSQAHPLLFVFLMSVISIAAYKPLDIAFTQLFKNYLFKKKTFAHMTLMELAEELALVLDLQELSNLIVNTFGEVFHLKTAALLIPNRVRGDFEIASAYGWNISDCYRVRFSKDSLLIKLIHSTGGPILVRDRAIRTFSWQEANALAHDFDCLRASWIFPLFVKEELLGAVGLGAFSAHGLFDEADFQVFREFARSAAKSLRNALSVSELKTANGELQDIQSQLLQATKLTAIEQLATGLAHEIHNPLTIISGKAQVLLLQKDRNQIDKKVEEVLKTIVKQTKRAADITRKLLMFSQSSGLPKERLQLEQILEDTISLVSYQTSLEGIRISRAITRPIPPLYANVQEMREVFFNLLLNAVQSIGSQGKIHCEIRDRIKDQIVEVRISDTGRGIPPEHIDKLFNPFFTTRPEAVGLGLFVTKQIIHRYAGSIRVESRTGEGSLFTIQWPYLESSPMADQKAETLSLFPNA